MVFCFIFQFIFGPNKQNMIEDEGTACGYTMLLKRPLGRQRRWEDTIIIEIRCGDMK